MVRLIYAILTLFLYPRTTNIFFIFKGKKGLQFEFVIEVVISFVKHLKKASSALFVSQ